MDNHLSHFGGKAWMFFLIKPSTFTFRTFFSTPKDDKKRDDLCDIDTGAFFPENTEILKH